jgi:hypothetical protein
MTGAAADDILELQRAFDDAELRGDADRLGDLLAGDFLRPGAGSHMTASAVIRLAHVALFRICAACWRVPRER